jgi:hypothetical protein
MTDAFIVIIGSEYTADGLVNLRDPGLHEWARQMIQDRDEVDTRFYYWDGTHMRAISAPDAQRVLTTYLYGPNDDQPEG